MSKIFREIPVEKQIARHMQWWERRRDEWQQQGRPAPRPAAKPLGPYVSVSRELGSAGNELAAALAAKLGWQLYDREILEAIASRSHVREELVARFDEHVQSALDTYLRNLFTNQILDNTQYLHHLTQVLLGIAQYGEAVIVGRGAHLLLPAACGLRVRVVASWETRKKRVMQELGCDEKRAQQELASHDKEQQDFLEKHFRSQPNDPRAYDVVINTDKLEIAAAADLVARLAQAKLKITLT